MLSAGSLVVWPPPTPFPQLAISPLGLIGLLVTKKKKLRAGEGLPSSRHNCLCMPLPLHRRVLLRCIPSSSRVPWPSPGQSWLGSLLSLSGSLSRCGRIHFHYGLQICFIAQSATFHRASAAGFRRHLPASYGAAWTLPRLNLHQ